MKPPKWVTVFICPTCEKAQCSSGTCLNLCGVEVAPFWYQVHGPVSGGTEAQ
jgi:hypothetical protein